MESNILQSLTGTAPAGADGATRRADKPDSDAFTACLDDAGRARGDAGKANVQMIDDNKKKDGPASKKEADKKDGAAEAQVAGKTPAGKMTPAMQKLMQVNPDTMSMADKQAMRVGEFSHEGEVGKAVARGAGMPTAPGAGLLTSAVAQAAKNADPHAGVERAVRAQKGHDKFSLPDEPEIKEKKAKHAGEEAKSTTQPSLDHLLTQEVQATDKVNKADQVKAYEQRQNVLDQIIKHVSVKNFENQTELNLRLNPEYLGEMNINLVHTKDGGVTTHIKTSSRVTRDLINGCKNDLAQQAIDKGIRLGKIKVTLVDNVD